MSLLLNKRLQQLREQQRKAFVSFVTAGDPTLPATLPLLQSLAANGADILEIGVPFSDPAADGKEIQRSGQRALANGVNVASILQLVRAFRAQDSATPIVLMGYYNPIASYGEAEFVRACAQAGVDGLIVVDLPHEESSTLRALCKQSDVALISLIAPTTSLERVRSIAATAQGFIYYIGVRGITGSQSTEAAEVLEHLRAIQELTDLPVLVGFGIKSAQQVRELSALCSGVVVGSCLVEQIRLGVEQQQSAEQIIDRVRAKLVELKA